MRRHFFWVKVLALTNLVTIVFLAIVSFHYQVPLKVLQRLGLIKTNEQTVSTYDVRNNLFSEYYPKKYKVVMLGDSITAGTEWNELLGINDIANRGIGGDTTEGFYNRLSNIYLMKPELCFIMGGINDISGFYPVNLIQSNFEEIIKNLLENGITPIIQSTLYVSNEHPHWERLNHTVDELNESLKNICQKYNILFLDINTKLSVDGGLRNEYTYDGVHLTGLGYKEWSKIIIPLIENK
jgi:lysophospholipase L1-like esterase